MLSSLLQTKRLGPHDLPSAYHFRFFGLSVRKWHRIAEVRFDQRPYIREKMH